MLAATSGCPGWVSHPATGPIVDPRLGVGFEGGPWRDHLGRSGALAGRHLKLSASSGPLQEGSENLVKDAGVAGRIAYEWSYGSAMERRMPGGRGVGES